MGFGFALTLAATLGASVVSPSGVELERIADYNYEPPGLPGTTFEIEQTDPVVCNGQVVFAGVTELNSNLALYAASSSGVQVVANVLTPMPGSPGATFLAADDPACGGNQVLFIGGDDVTPPIALGGGVFAWWNSDIERLAPPGIEFGPIQIFSFRKLSAEGPDFAATASLRQLGFGGKDGVVVKRGAGPVELIAEGFSTILPGHDVPPQAFASPVLRGQEVFFIASVFPQIGVYRWTADDGFSLLADNQTFYPDVGSSFAGFGSLQKMDFGLVFNSLYNAGFGIFALQDDGHFEPLVVPGQLTTEGETILSAQYPSGAGSLLSFIGRTVENPSFDAVFARTQEGAIQRILSVGDTLEGRQVRALLTGADGQHVALRVQPVNPPFDIVLYRAFFGRTVDIPMLSRSALASLIAALALAGFGLLRRCG